MALRDPREECLDLEERGQQQLERLQSVLNRAFKSVPFYRNRFQEFSVDQSQIERLEDLATVPFTERVHFSENYPYGLSAVPLRDVVRIHTAPGIYLQPTVSGYTKHDRVVWRELVARALVAAGVSGVDILQIDLDAGLANWGREYKDGAEIIEASVIPLTLLHPEKQLMILRDYRTSTLVTTASAARHLVQGMYRANLNPNALALKTLILVGEPPDDSVRAQLEDQLHVKTWVHYGLSDVPGPALAFECEVRNGLHVSEDHFFAEVIDSTNGVPVAEGEEGELVLTTLTTRAFPLIRFRTGDRVRLIPGNCACGRTLRRIQWLHQRTDELMVIRGVKVHQRHALMVMERVLGFMPEKQQFFIRRSGMRDYLEIWLQVEERLFSDEIKQMERLAQRLGMELEQELGVTVRMRFKEGGSFDFSRQEPSQDSFAKNDCGIN
jgi:phenylacetate-CoA ligase